MSEWAVRRFYRQVLVASTDGGHTVHLDGRMVRTPAKAPLVVPTVALAEAIAREWREQGERINPLAMPATRAANSAIDKVRGQKEEIVDLLLEYGGTDLLCYRAETPEELVERQNRAWNPLLDWAADRFGARLNVTSGVMPAEQDPTALAALRRPLEDLSAFRLAAVHDLIALSGSLVIGLAAIHSDETPEALWDTSRLDEDWQAEIWGRDAEADAMAAARRADFLFACHFEKLSRD